MHEGAVCVEIMEIVQNAAEANSLSRVTRIDVATGLYSCLNEQQLNFYFNVAQQDTCMEGAWISVVKDPSLRGVADMYVRAIEGE